MKKTTAIIVILLILLISGCTEKPVVSSEREDKDVTESNSSKSEIVIDDSTEYDTEYIKFRSGLNNTYHALTSDKELTVAYLGGSITAGAGATDPNFSAWRPLVTQHLKNEFPSAKITEINRGVGSAGSLLATFYLDDKVLPHKPDLVFLEMAINDNFTVSDIERVYIQYETIIRKLRETNPYCDIVAVFTTSDKVDATQPFLQAMAQDEVAGWYSVPSVDVGRKMRIEKKLVRPKVGDQYTPLWKKYFTDNVHPTDEGHKFYAETLIELLNKAFDVAETQSVSKTEKKLPEKKNSELMYNLNYVETTDFDLNGCKNWQHAGEGMTFVSQIGIKNYIYTENPDNELVYKFKGSNFYIFSSWIPSATGSEFQYSIDGGDWVSMRGYMVYPIPIVEGLKNTEHTIKFKAGGVGSNAPTSDDKQFKIGAFLYW
ncbi:MAG: SGNH/GDSL hydrolase family protein [Clostridia bacterium]|nr:SGNH/GDSL hydrolase family protein [Clostridia bacterium]